MVRIVLIGAVVIVAGVFVFFETYTPAISEDHGKVQAELFLGEAGDDQPLIVGFGGSEGGNAWASDRWKATRERFIEKGYAFLAIGYFGGEGIPAELDRVALDAIYDSIMAAADHPKINRRKIALIGGSKGAELALNLASRYPEFRAVVGIVPTHVSFPASNFAAATSSWTFNGEEVPYVPMGWSALPSLMRGDLRAAFSVMLRNDEAVASAGIAVERINGPILLVSATQDEMWPSTQMSEAMVRRLKGAGFPHHYEHLAIDGGHVEPLKHFDRILGFLNEHFRTLEVLGTAGARPGSVERCGGAAVHVSGTRDGPPAG